MTFDFQVISVIRNLRCHLHHRQSLCQMLAPFVKMLEEFALRVKTRRLYWRCERPSNSPTVASPSGHPSPQGRMTARGRHCCEGEDDR